MEKEKEENFWQRKIFGQRRRRRRGGKYLEKEKLGHRRKKEKIFEDGKSDDRQTNRISSCTLDPFLC